MPKPGSGTFQYPGAKTTIAPWIVSRFPDHELFVDVFGGSGSVMMYKEESDVEVYNDLNSHLVEFFEVCRDHGDELSEWLEWVPYSRELHREWLEDWAKENHPSSKIERAGRFFYLQETSFAGRLEDDRTFSTQYSIGDRSRSDRVTRKFSRKTDNPSRIQSRFREVIIENLDYRELVEKYDRTSAFLYFDPPYVDVDEYYVEHSSFDHSEFVSFLSDLQSKWMVSYADLPPGLEEYYTTSRSRRWTMAANKEEADAGTETLVMNYNPSETPSFSPGNQQLTAFADGGSE